MPAVLRVPIEARERARLISTFDPMAGSTGRYSNFAEETTFAWCVNFETRLSLVRLSVKRDVADPQPRTACATA